MTREKAVAVSNTLNDIENFEMFMDEIEKILRLDLVSPEFDYELNLLLQNELARLNEALEKL